ncbi:MAG: hemolysin III family protein [Halobacteriovoraceae bacterium]|nr:hemolysin III family protein [Halobacteriovoraceae bacterium]|tara:strand:- start:6892 stop:7536 length:645 start_codon:yes stop_codon:yes gene_type:complete
MRKNQKIIECSPREEIVNVITHIPGVVLGAIFVAILLLKNYDQSSLAQIVSYLIYGLSFITVFSASSLYHNTKNERRRKILKKIDHASIFFFMGGCYTPFIVINMVSDYKYHFLALVWFLVAFGIVYKFLSQFKNQVLSLTFYFSFGLMCLLAKGQMLDHMPRLAFNLLILGGLLYSVGVIFYIMKKLPYNHGIWHLFVLLGASCHFAAIYHTI